MLPCTREETAETSHLGLSNSDLRRCPEHVINSQKILLRSTDPDVTTGLNLLNGETTRVLPPTQASRYLGIWTDAANLSAHAANRITRQVSSVLLSVHPMSLVPAEFVIATNSENNAATAHVTEHQTISLKCLRNLNNQTRIVATMFRGGGAAAMVGQRQSLDVAFLPRHYSPAVGAIGMEFYSLVDTACQRDITLALLSLLAGPSSLLHIPDLQLASAIQQGPDGKWTRKVMLGVKNLWDSNSLSHPQTVARALRRLGRTIVHRASLPAPDPPASHLWMSRVPTH